MLNTLFTPLQISGREMFEFNPDMVMADDDEADVDMSLYKQEDDEEDGQGEVRKNVVLCLMKVERGS